MEMLKRGMALALALTVLGSAGAQAVGAAPKTGTPEPVVLKSVYEDKTQEFWPYVDQVLVLDKNESLKESALPKSGKYVDEKGGKHETDLKWEVNTSSLKKAGLHEVSGAPVLVSPMTLAEGFDGKVSYPVFRKGTKEVLEVKPLQPHGLKDILIAKDSKDPLAELTITTTDLRYSSGKTGYILSTDQWKWDWDVSKVDTCVTGKATITGTLKDQPDWIKVAEADKTVEHTVYVMPADSIQLVAPTDLSEEGKLTFQWIYDSEKVTKAVLEMEKDGKWTACDEGWYTYQKPEEKKVEEAKADDTKQTETKEQTKTESKAEAEKQTEKVPAALILDLTKIPAKETYTFRLNYVDEVDGKAEDKTTDPLYITIPENVKTLAEKAEGKIPAQLKIGEKPEVKPEVKPDPEPEKDPEPEAEVPKDIVTDTYITLSGKSLAEKIAKGKTVLFEMKGGSLEIPSQLLTDLKLKDNELITVSLTIPKTGTVQVVVNAGGKVITDLKGSVVKMGYTLAKNKTLTCKDITGKLSPKVTYDSKTKMASFPINQAGTYTLTAKTVSTTSTKKPSSTKKPTTTKKPSTSTTKKPTTNKNTTTAKPGTGTAAKPSGSAISSNDENDLFLEDGTYEEEPFFFEEEDSEDTLFLEEMEAETLGAEEDEDAPRTLWDEQTPTALALIAVVGMLTAAGLLLRKWFSE